MKALVYGLYVLFAVLMIATFYVAHRVYDGLVEPHYYERARDFFSDRGREESMGLAFQVPDELEAGANRFAAVVSAGNEPLSGAQAVLSVGRVSTAAHDTAYPLREETPGRYVADIMIPAPGKWLFRMELRRGEWETSHRWSVSVR